MDKMLQTPPKIPSSSSDTQNTPPEISVSGKNGTPDRLMVPKPFKYPERYTSPTDQMMSPVTRGILARSKKGRKVFPPSATLHKIQALHLQESASLPN